MKWIKLFENWKYKNPKFLYHLTPSKNIVDVKTNGLKIEYSKQHKFVQGIYLTDDFYTASNYKFLDENHDDYFIIEIPFKNLNTEFMFPDDYELFDLLEDEYLEYEDLLSPLGIEEGEVYNNMEYIWKTLTWKDSMRICNQILYTKNIKPIDFSKIYNQKEIDKKLRSLY